ncbi:hypothetical protein OAT67_08770, partial [Bacteriovoracaceae bacterium]|nr:hypothetical protein [Bacteriovoracaceae bacterium]
TSRYPIFLRFQASEFNHEVNDLLTKMKFSQMGEKEASDVTNVIKKEEFGRLLTLKPANFTVLQQIKSVSESDRYGKESIVPKDGYKVYRYKEMGLMVYSMGVSEWEMGVSPFFGKTEFSAEFFTVINRYLSWCLAPFGVIGFWGVPVEDGVVVLKQKEAKGEVIYLDIRERKILSFDGVESMNFRFKILRLDKSLKNRNIRMGSEELLSFLSVHTSFFDCYGHSNIIRQVLQTISRITEGSIYPYDSYKPRTDMSPETEAA